MADAEELGSTDSLSLLSDLSEDKAIKFSNKSGQTVISGKRTQ